MLLKLADLLSMLVGIIVFSVALGICLDAGATILKKRKEEWMKKKN